LYRLLRGLDIEVGGVAASGSEALAVRRGEGSVADSVDLAVGLVVEVAPVAGGKGRQAKTAGTHA